MTQNKKTNIIIIKYIPLQQGLRLGDVHNLRHAYLAIIKYIPLQQGLRRCFCLSF